MSRRSCWLAPAVRYDIYRASIRLISSVLSSAMKSACAVLGAFGSLEASRPRCTCALICRADSYSSCSNTARVRSSPLGTCFNIDVCMIYVRRTVRLYCSPYRPPLKTSIAGMRINWLTLTINRFPSCIGFSIRQQAGSYRTKNVRISFTTS